MRAIPRCNDCNAVVVWFDSPFARQGRRPFDPKPVDGRTHHGAPAYPVENGSRAWRFPELVDDLQARRQTSRDDAEDEVYDMPWHTLHDCPRTPTDQESTPR